MANPLLELAQFVAEETRSSKVAVIFDLDSTLFCVSSRTQAILRKLGAHPEFVEKYSEVSRILQEIEVLPTDWGIRAALERHPIETTDELVREIRNFWRKHFFAGNYLDHDTIYPSANEYVRHLHEQGAEILYLTGRGENMREGTRKALSRWGFPFFDDSRLYMKSSEVQTDEAYKANVLKELVKNYDHIWFFENEPVIIEQVRELVPQVRIVFVNSVHSGRAPAPEGLPQIGMSYTDGLPAKKS